MKRCAIVACAGVACGAASAEPWATSWENYWPGSNADVGYTDPGAALGEPSRFTGDNAPFMHPSAVTAFNGPFNIDQVVSLGTGGHITLVFSEPARNDPRNPFGIDLLIFGNSSFYDVDYPNGIVGGVFSEGGVVELSADGVTWVTATGIVADGMIPTIGYSDVTDPFSTLPGSVPSNFQLPVDPSIDFTGMTYAEVLAAYNGSGGGTGVDIGAYGLESVSYVRISNPGPTSIEIDAIGRVAPIPAPASLALLLAGGSIARRRRP